MGFPDFKNWRFNPFTSVFNSVPIASELHVISYDEETNAFGIRLFEGVKLVSPVSTVSIVELPPGVQVFTEVPRTTAPSSGQYRVDYLADTYYGTSFIEFNADADGLSVAVSYDGLGTNVKDRYQLLQATIIPTNLGVEGSIETTDNLIVGGFASVVDDPTTNLQLGNRGYNDGRLSPLFEDWNFDDTEKWILDTGVSFDATGGTGGKRSMSFVGNGALHGAVYLAESPGGQKYHPFTVEDAVNGYVRLKSDGTFDSFFYISIAYYDKDKVFLSAEDVSILNANLTTSYKYYSFGAGSAPAGAAYYVLQFNVPALATTGQIDLDFWKIGNNIGLSNRIVSNMLPASGLGTHGLPANAAFSGKGYIPLNPGQNQYVFNGSGNDSGANIVIEGTEFFHQQVVAVNLQLQGMGNASAENYFYGGRTGLVGFAQRIYQGNLSAIIHDEFYIIPVRNYSAGKAVIRMWKIGPEPGPDVFIHGLFVN